MYTVVIPVLNEVENIPHILRRLDPGYGELIFCDNGSTDGTATLISELCVGNPKLRLSSGKGSVADAIYRGICEASFRDVVILDGDLSHPPELVKALAKELEEYDFVSGSRYLNGGHTKDSLVNKIFSFGLNAVTFPLAPKMTDRSTGFFGVRRTLVRHPFKSYCKPALETRVTCPIISSRELAYSFSPRLKGHSKLQRQKAVPITVRDIIVLYLKKYKRMIKYALVGAMGTGIYIGFLAFFTEVAGFYYIISAILGSCIAFFFNFTFNRLWTFNTLELEKTDPDYEYVSWHKGNLLQKYWKRKIANLSLGAVSGSSGVLDVGCGSSPLLGKLPGKVVGLDRDEGKLVYQSSRCHDDVKLVQCDLESKSFPNLDCVGSIVCNNLLEHLTDPVPVVRWMASKLSLAGVLVITVPNYSSRLTPVAEYAYGKLMPKSYAEDHCYKFTEESLDSMCKKYGLELVKRHKVFTDMVSIYRKGV